MCFDLDSTPPIRALAGAVVNHVSLTLNSADGNEFRVFHAWPAETTGKAIIILPDVRGLHHYYEDLATRFAEIGVEAVALDYFGRTAGTGDRGDDFDYGPHVAQTRWDGLSADIKAAAAYLRSDAGHGVKSVYSIGFCMGGRVSFLATTVGLGLAGGIGFYGFPGGPSRNDTPAPMDVVGKMECPILGIFGGADGAIPVASVREFRDALTTAGLENDIVVEPDAPHSFFDRKQAEFQKQSEDAWARVQRFIEAHPAA
jgi:carboxymethylenebutenolidase